MANILAVTAGDWHTGSNWVGGVVPTATDVAILNGKVMTLVEGASITCSSIEGGTALESLVNAIKAKTDQLIFLADGIKASAGAGEVGIETELNELETLLSQIKTKTDALTITSGVNAVDTTV